jgi:hypothetical protein
MVVTGTMKHLAPNVCDVYVSGLDEPLGVTTTHPIWSETRQKFVFAEDLQLGEELKTASGSPAAVVRVHQKRGPPESVFNLEVDGEHVYHVASNALLVHNDSGSAVVTASNNHVAIEVLFKGKVISTEVELVGKTGSIREPTEWLAKKGIRQKLDIYLPNAKAAQALQSSLLGTKFPYMFGIRDCVSHVKEVLKAGGVDVSGLPNTIEGFLESLARLTQ